MNMGTVEHDLAAKQAITEAIYRYCRGLDRLDRELFESVWHSDATVDYGVTYSGSAAGLVDNFWVSHPKLTGHSHQVTNILIEVDGDRAASESYCIGTLWKVNDAGVLTQLRAVGRYLDTWSCRDGVWAIDHRKFVYDAVFPSSHPVPADTTGDYIMGLAAKRDPMDTQGRRDRTDPSYEVLDTAVLPAPK
jgi:SnoaL-like protein